MDLNFEHILFIDVETVPQYASYADVPEAMKKLWEKKSAYFRTEEQRPEDVYERAGIWAEFGRIICLSAGFIYRHNGQPTLRLKSFAGHNEKALLQGFCRMLAAFIAKKKNVRLCAHNGKEFDFPYIARRLLINSLPLPEALDVAGRKPWETLFLDTMELWKFGDYKHFCSLELLTTVLNIDTPKDDIDGSQVASVYYIDGDLPRIIRYCEKDVLAVAQLLLRYRGQALLDKVESVTGTNAQI
ncbi:MAG: 3'-5' exonuclease [Prevotellaceae bacterium]|nr:3'-5' exonuclease [Prevotellaceae bacterium]